MAATAAEDAAAVHRDDTTTVKNNNHNHNHNHNILITRTTPCQWEDRIRMVRCHFQQKGYRVHSGLQFGCELVLYADSPDRVHSDFAVHVVPHDGSLDWKLIQSLVRSMPDLHKTLILAQVVPRKRRKTTTITTTTSDRDNKDDNTSTNTMQQNEEIDDDDDDDYNHDDMWDIQELAITTEHAPFRHKKTVEVGGQRKRQKK